MAEEDARQVGEARAQERDSAPIPTPSFFCFPMARAPRELAMETRTGEGGRDAGDPEIPPASSLDGAPRDRLSRPGGEEPADPGSCSPRSGDVDPRDRGRGAGRRGRRRTRAAPSTRQDKEPPPLAQPPGRPARGLRPGGAARSPPPSAPAGAGPALCQPRRSPRRRQLRPQSAGAPGEGPAGGARTPPLHRLRPSGSRRPQS